MSGWIDCVHTGMLLEYLMIIGYALLLRLWVILLKIEVAESLMLNHTSISISFFPCPLLFCIHFYAVEFFEFTCEFKQKYSVIFHLIFHRVCKNTMRTTYKAYFIVTASFDVQEHTTLNRRANWNRVMMIRSQTNRITHTCKDIAFASPHWHQFTRWFDCMKIEL